MRAKLFTFLCLAVLSGIKLNGQDFTFSQFQEMPLLRNPAIAGLFAGDIRIQSAYRSQWLSVTTPYKTMAISAETKIPAKYQDDFFTASLLITNDVAGDSRLSRLQILPSINFLKSINDNNGYIALGFIGGLVQSQFDPTKLTFDDQFQNGSFNPLNPTSQTFSKTSITYFDASVGMSYSDRIGENTKFYLGGAYFHANKPKVSFLDDKVLLKPRSVINAGLSIETSEYDNFYIFGDYISQAGNRQGLMGLMYSHIIGEYMEDDNVSLSLGAFYRWGDAVIPAIKLNLYKVSLGISYDMNVSKLSRASQLRGGYEFTASYRSFLNIRNTSLNKVKCPVTF
ncbi:MAG TPA: PorP/SprF family type IX secretion system membrane protein [Chitinophagaceae bacterium]|nr:PorP/SprF family type IX secretion system membrane protein [Chitinophagaceae bacterium]HPH30621.1 PorP/SprF family type IX secretion system membrane protein [Chitinophagaceae bacterium]HPN58582.1 PorP/SprF family type IX secretion system membrane protein [Chitinophagaceae bacterium]